MQVAGREGRAGHRASTPTATTATSSCTWVVNTGTPARHGHDRRDRPGVAARGRSTSASTDRSRRRTCTSSTEDERVIPVERTKTPFDVFELTRVGTEGIEALDTEALNSSSTTWPTSPRARPSGHRPRPRPRHASRPRSTSARPSCAQLLERADTLVGDAGREGPDARAAHRRQPADPRPDRQPARRAGRRARRGQRGGRRAHRVIVENETELDRILHDAASRPSTPWPPTRSELDTSLAWLGPGFYSRRRPAATARGSTIYVRTLGPRRPPRRACAILFARMDCDGMQRLTPRPGCRAVRRPSWLAVGCSVLPGGGGGTYDGHRVLPAGRCPVQAGQVRVLGLPAGRVQSRRDRRQPGPGRRCRSTTTSPCPTTCTAVIVPQSLIGERYVQLMPAWTSGRAQGRGRPRHRHRPTPSSPSSPTRRWRRSTSSSRRSTPTASAAWSTTCPTALDGNGASLNRALDNVGDLVETFASKDDELVAIVESFDRFTQTLRTREQQLGVVLDAFSAATQVLADERAEPRARWSPAWRSCRRERPRPGGRARHRAARQTSPPSPGWPSRSSSTSTPSPSCSTAARCSCQRAGRRRTTTELRAMNLRNNFGPLAQSILDPILQAHPRVPGPCRASRSRTVVPGRRHRPWPRSRPLRRLGRDDQRPPHTPIDGRARARRQPDGCRPRTPAPSVASRIAGGRPVRPGGS